MTRSWFHHNQNGILAGANADSDVVILRSPVVPQRGRGRVHAHLYIGPALAHRHGSYLWGADVGHELKSRAARNTIVGNRIADRDATSSYSLDLPNGGSSLIAGNVIIQGPHSENSTVVSYGAEGFTHGSRRLWVVNNTFVNRRPTGTFVGLAEGSRARLRNNLLVGPGDLTDLAGVGRGPTAGSGCRASSIPPLTTSGSGPARPRSTEACGCRNRGGQPGSTATRPGRYAAPWRAGSTWAPTSDVEPPGVRRPPAP